MMLIKKRFDHLLKLIFRYLTFSLLCTTLLMMHNSITYALCQLTVTPSSGTAPLIVTLNAAQSGIPSNLEDISWDPGDGGTISSLPLPIATYTYENPGVYTPVFTATDSEGTVWKCTTIVTVREASLIGLNVTARPIEGKAPLEVIFTSSVTGASIPYEYEYDFGDGIVEIKKSSTVIHIYENAGVYEANITLTDGDGNTASYSLAITVLPADNLSVALNSIPKSGAAPLTVTLLTSITSLDGTSPYIYIYSFGDDNEDITTANKEMQHTYNQSGQYTADVNVIDSAGKIGVASTNITVEESLSMEVALNVSDTNGSIPFDAIFTASVTGGSLPYKYIWDFGDGSTLSPQRNSTHVHTYLKEGVFEAKVTVEDSTGQQKQSDPITITTVQPILFNIEADPQKGFIVAGATFTTQISVSIVSGTPPFTYTYNFADGTPEFTPEEKPWKVSHDYSKKGEYIVNVTVEDSTGQKLQKNIIISVSDESDIISMSSAISSIESQVGAVEDFSSFYTIVYQANDAFSDLIDTVQSAPEVIKEQQSQLIIQEAKSILSGINNKMTSLIIDSTTDANDVIPVLKETGSILGKIVQSNVPLSSDMIIEIKAISKNAIKAGLNDALEAAGLSSDDMLNMLNDPQKAQAFLESRKDMIDDLFNVSSVSLDIPYKTSRDLIDQLSEALGLSQTEADILYNSFASTLDVLVNITQSADEENINILDLLIGILGDDSGAFSDGSIVGNSVDSISGVINIDYSSSVKQAMSLIEFGIMSDYLPPGLHTLPDGTQIGVTSDYAFQIVPAASDASALIAEGAKRGFTPQFTQDGRLIVTFEDVIFSLGMAWNVEQENSLAAGTVSFDSSGSDPASESYSLLVRYGDGSSQMMPPSIMAQNSLFAMLDQWFPGKYSLDRNTGVLNVDGWLFKPDYAFESLSDIDYSAIEQSGGVVINDLGFDIADYNSDGLIDLRYYSPDPKGRQILFTIQ